MRLTFFFIGLCFFLGCKSDPDTLVDVPNNPSFLSYIRANVNGNPIDLNIPFNGVSSHETYKAYQEQTDTDDNCININYETGLRPNQDMSLQKMSITFLGFLDETTTTCSEDVDVFNSLFEITDYPYPLNTSGFGANIKYYTSNNGSATIYTSYGAQNDNAVFTITSVEVKDCSPKKCMTIYGVFSAILYNAQDNSDTLPITDGEFKLKVESYN